jgi:hypothetical protein
MVSSVRAAFTCSLRTARIAVEARRKRFSIRRPAAYTRVDRMLPLFPGYSAFATKAKKRGESDAILFNEHTLPRGFLLIQVDGWCCYRTGANAFAPGMERGILEENRDYYLGCNTSVASRQPGKRPSKAGSLLRLGLSLENRFSCCFRHQSMIRLICDLAHQPSGVRIPRSRS